MSLWISWVRPEGAPFDRAALDALLELAGQGITGLIALQREIVGSFLA
jgi:ribonuclease PH